MTYSGWKQIRVGPFGFKAWVFAPAYDGPDLERATDVACRLNLNVYESEGTKIPRGSRFIVAAENPPYALCEPTDPNRFDTVNWRWLS